MTNGAGDIGIILARPNPLTLVTDARDLEQAGASAIWLTDHLFWHEPTVDAIGALALIAHGTESCRVGTGILQLPLRSPAAVAKSISFVDHLSNGRVILGLGVGEHQGEYRAAHRGDLYRRRGDQLDQDTATLRSTWGGGSLTHDRYVMAPARQVPIWFGGRSERARRRVVAHGNGWFPHLCQADWFATNNAALDQDLVDAGREPTSVERGVAIAVSVDGVEDISPLDWLGSLYRLDPKLFRSVLVAGDAASVRSQLDAFRAAGANHLALMIAGDHPLDHLLALLDAPSQ